MSDTNRKCEIFLAGGVKDIWRHFAPLVITRAAPSSSHLLHRAKTINLKSGAWVKRPEHPKGAKDEVKQA